MGQGLLTSRGGSGGGVDWSIIPGFTGWNHVYEEITSNKDWIVPRAKDNTFNVIVFGGGGGATTYSNYFYIPGVTDINNNLYMTTPTSYVLGGGGGGYMCNATLKLQFGNDIRISIGKNGSFNENGGTTSFGEYLSANGGECAKIVNMRTVNNGKNDIIIADGIQGGNGGTGGGSIFIETNTGQYTKISGGSGQYGGGGGGWIGGKGGIAGGNGGSLTVDAEKGTNTKAINTVYNGDGNTGMFFNIGNIDPNMNNKLCGGGGYGGNGGNGGIILSRIYNGINYCVYAGGGGGGWGNYEARGGDGNFYRSNAPRRYNLYKAGSGGGWKKYAYGSGVYVSGGRDDGYADPSDGDWYLYNHISGKGVCVIDYIAPVFK